MERMFERCEQGDAETVGHYKGRKLRVGGSDLITSISFSANKCTEVRKART